MINPSLFIGSSTEGLPVAEALQTLLQYDLDVTIWSQGVFRLSQSYLDSLLDAISATDFAVLVLTPDDVTTSRQDEFLTPRDNVLFELGLFMGRLGRDRSFFVYDRTSSIKLPSDLLGISGATYSPRADGNLEPALGPVATAIKKAVKKAGPLPNILGASAIRRGSATPQPDISGIWYGYALDGPNPDKVNSELQIELYGAFVRASIKRNVKDGYRTFRYEGVLTSGQIVLFFEDEKGPGFVVGTMVLHLAGDLKSLVGRSTFYDHARGMVISRRRRYTRTKP